MARIGLIYGSDSGSTKRVAKKIKAMFDDDTMGEPLDAGRIQPEQILAYDYIIAGTPTVGVGEIPSDWEEFMARIDGADFSGKTVAVFGLGDQFCYSDSFADAMGELAEFFADRGAKVVGAWPVDGYSYEASQAEKDGHFVGLALDEDNQADKSPDRLKSWLNQIAGDFGFAAVA